MLSATHQDAAGGAIFNTMQLEMANRLSDICMRVGYALLQIQELERVSATYFVLLVQASKGMGLIEGDTLIEKAQAKTFGATLNQIAKAGLLESKIQSRLNTLLNERNWLVHRFHADSRSAVHNDEACKALIIRLDAIADEALALLKEIGALTEQFVIQKGVSKNFIDRMSRQILNQWYDTDDL